MPLALMNLDPTTGDDLRDALEKVNEAIDVLRTPHTVTITGAVAGSGLYTPESLAITLSVSFTQTVWHAGNDGPDSGLDADTLDGLQSIYFLNASNLNAGTVPLSRLPQGEGLGLNADLLDGQHGSYYRNAGNLNAGTIPVGRLPLGAGQGIDADLLDGKQGSEYVQATSANTFTANNTVNGVVIGDQISTYTGIGLTGWDAGASGQYLLIARIGASDKNTYLNAQTGGTVTLTPNGGDASTAFSVSATQLIYAGAPVYHAKNMVRGIDDPAQSIGFSHLPDGRLQSCTRTIAGQQYIATYEYSGSALSRTTIQYAGKIRTYTYSYTSGRISNVLINES